MIDSELSHEIVVQLDALFSSDCASDLKNNTLFFVSIECKIRV
jgi:hypothetical protein